MTRRDPEMRDQLPGKSPDLSTISYRGLRCYSHVKIITWKPLEASRVHMRREWSFPARFVSTGDVGDERISVGRFVNSG